MWLPELSLSSFMEMSDVLSEAHTGISLVDFAPFSLAPLLQTPDDPLLPHIPKWRGISVVDFAPRG
jgi:hypothetical protein